MTEQTPAPAVGQTWQDNDPRIAADTPGRERYVYIDRTDDEYAYGRAWYSDHPRRRPVRIKLRRFKPASYWYLENGPRP